MIQQNFLNEERYAISYVRGKVNIKKWGRYKIKLELKSRQVSDYSINKALKEIEKLGHSHGHGHGYTCANIAEKALKMHLIENSM